MRIRKNSSVACGYMRSSLLLTSSRYGVPAALLAAFALAGCAQQPQAKRSKEYFPSSVYGAASPRVVEDGQPVPRGGGRYLVGRPYTIAGRVYTPTEVALNTSQSGRVSWYGAAFHGRRTSNGEVYDMRSITAAHPTWPLPSYVRITNTQNGRSIVARLNDRGPFHSNRIMDVSSRVAEALDFKRMGTGQVKIDYLGKAGLAGSDDQILLASLRTDGKPAQLDGNAPVTMIAEAEGAKPAAPSRLASMFAPVEETTIVSRQDASVLSPAGGAGPAGLEVLPPPRPAILGGPRQLAETPLAAFDAPAAATPQRAAGFAPFASLPELAPLPPARPMSFR